MNRKGVARAEKNTSFSMTQPSRVIDVREAYAALRMGHPIDIAVGYYEKEGYVTPDFYMMDRIGQLKELAKYRQLASEHKAEIEKLQGQQREAHQKAVFEDAVQREVAARTPQEVVTK